jgi:osmotically-inducible protein OsmY
MAHTRGWARREVGREFRGATTIRKEVISMASKLLSAGLGAAAGGALVYFLDPQSGNRRRKIAADQASSKLRHGASDFAGTAQGAAQTAVGSVMGKVKPESAPEDDTTLARKVETEVFRGPEVPKGDIVVDAVDGVVTLRGQVPAASMKDELERKARDVTGVRDVQNLLHLPGEDAPMLDASAAGRSAR